jgi:hypothetical protein
MLIRLPKLFKRLGCDQVVIHVEEQKVDLRDDKGAEAESCEMGGDVRLITA